MVGVLMMVLVGHLLGDWFVQTDHMAANKTTSWWAMHAHCVTYHAVMAVLVVPLWPDWRLVVLLAVSYVTHAVIDRRWPVRWLLRVTGSPKFAEQEWGVVVVDQVLHLSILMTTLVVLA